MVTEGHHTQGRSPHVRVWDAPTRLFHWLTVLAFAAAWLTAEDNRYLDIHVFAGYLILGLLVFRLLWGLIGSHYAQFRAFAYAWPTVWAYLKGLITGKASHYLGHNPAGSWAIFLILLLTLFVTVSGLLVLGGEERHGPLAGFVPFEIGSGLHKPHRWFAWTLLAIIVMHVYGVIVESILHRENLVWSMVTGEKPGDDGSTAVGRYGLLGTLLLLTTGLAAFAYFHGYIQQTKDRPYVPFVGPALPDNKVWRDACGECHLAFHPTLLPARSWEKLLAGQNNHFSESLDLDVDTVATVRSFLMANAAESGLTEAAQKISRSTRANDTPLRITETDYWRKKHRKVSDTYWNHPNVKTKFNCGACHLDAEAGTFEDGAMRLPALDQNH